MDRDEHAERRLRKWLDGAAALAYEIERDARVSERVRRAARGLHQAVIFVELHSDGFPISVHLDEGEEVIVGASAMSTAPSTPTGEPIPRCQQRIGRLCRFEAERWCSSCEKRICRRHSRLSFVEIVALFPEGRIDPDWRDRIHRSLCVTCHRLELWTGKPATEISDEEWRQFLQTPNGVPFLGVWEMKR
jgi:hypothetical protein